MKKQVLKSGEIISKKYRSSAKHFGMSAKAYKLLHYQQQEGGKGPKFMIRVHAIS